MQSNSNPKVKRDILEENQGNSHVTSSLIILLWKLDLNLVERTKMNFIVYRLTGRRGTERSEPHAT